MKFPDLTLALLSALLIFLRSTTADVGNLLQHAYCGSTGTFTANSTYDLNLQTLLTNLTTSATNSSNFGFAKSSFGSIPNEIFGLVLCRGDVNSSFCSFCLSQATQQIQNLCPYYKEATIYYEVCLLRFSNQDFLSTTDNSELQYIKWNNRKVTGSQTLFDSYLNYLMNTTADYAAFNSSKKFGAAQLNLYNAFHETYGLVQCTPDMSSLDCAYCLKNLIGEMPKYFSGKIGGRILGVRCNMRYEQNLFYSGVSLLSLTPPAENAPALALAPAPAPAHQGPELHQKMQGTIILCSNQRLSIGSGQGISELKNEVIILAKLRHKNLVNLLGFCLEENEKMLVYELLPNNSLDKFLSDPQKSEQLDWRKRYQIIEGIARGLLYLHEESQIKIIHRDLKTSNILLDENMLPKISDFGFAKLFVLDKSCTTTSRIVGTNGYIAPECLMSGSVSAKSDIFSYGIIVLEILTGRSITDFHGSGSAPNLISFVWKKWSNGRAVRVIDRRLGDTYPINEVLRCMHIALLCVQTDPSKRPDVASVVLMLSSYSMDLPRPSNPAFFMEGSTTTTTNGGAPTNTSADALREQYHKQNKMRCKELSINNVTITEMDPR
ncbi:cysteine-rich receptor-like protein kinase 10 isoform X2 [Carex littledalei]|uniref:Cysteine-rich receptor-like protein kinase 10 isoform X2 n=1 Tax=Carex littledalei TaxID=544730 RepID=A0A833UYX0_9POAL|nr:cysteine-rich receptor-like protein kinase 10 isoform X2 [Carex littledalei]